MRSVFFPAGGGGGREARVRWIRLLGLTPWTTTTAASSNGGVGGVGGGSGGGNGGGGSSRALSIPDFHPPLPRQQPLSLPSVFLPPPSRRRSPFAQPLSLTLPFCRLFFPAARLSAVLLVFLTKDPLNTSAVITSRQPPRVARLPQQTHPLIQPPPRASTGPTNRRATT